MADFCIRHLAGNVRPSHPFGYRTITPVVLVDHLHVVEGDNPAAEGVEVSLVLGGDGQYPGLVGEPESIPEHGD